VEGREVTWSASICGIEQFDNDEKQDGGDRSRFQMLAKIPEASGTANTSAASS
jgi:hypothetical protein